MNKAIIKVIIIIGVLLVLFALIYNISRELGVIIFVVGAIYLELDSILHKAKKNHNDEEVSDIVEEKIIDDKKTDAKQKSKHIDKAHMLLAIQNTYPEFNYDDFLSMIKVNFDKLTNRSIPLDKSLEMIATDDFINKYSKDMEFAKEIEADYISRSNVITIEDYDEETNQIKIKWTYSIKKYEYDRNGEIIKGLTRTAKEEKLFWVIKSNNVKYTNDIVHCPNCGAPLKYALDLKCNQCSSTFDYGNFWLLNDFIKENK